MVETTNPDREEVAFLSGGVECAADLFLHLGDEPAPGVVMGHGWNQTKQGLRIEASRLRDAGYNVMLIDYRGLGLSKGEPRGQIFPRRQVEDMRNAVTYFSRRAEVDATRIGVYGVSFGGGIALHAAALDTRVAFCVAQSPIVDGRRWMREIRTALTYRRLLDDLQQEFEDGYGVEAEQRTRVYFPAAGTMERHTGDAPAAVQAAYDMLPPWDPDNPNSCAYPGKCQDTFNPIVMMESFAHVIDFNPSDIIDMIAPRPLLIVANGGGDYDFVHTPESIQAAFAKAGEPKRLVFLPYGSLGFYQEPARSEVSRVVISFLNEHFQR